MYNIDIFNAFIILLSLNPYSKLLYFYQTNTSDLIKLFYQKSPCKNKILSPALNLIRKLKSTKKPLKISWNNLSITVLSSLILVTLVLSNNIFLKTPPLIQP